MEVLKSPDRSTGAFEEASSVILQHGAELIAYLFVDRSDNLFIGNHIKRLSLKTGDCNWENTAICVGASPVTTAIFASSDQ